MVTFFRLLASFVADLFKPRPRLEAELLCLRHQLNIALRRRPPRLQLQGSERALLVWMTRLWPSLLGTIQVVEPATILTVASRQGSGAIGAGNHGNAQGDLGSIANCVTSSER